MENFFKTIGQQIGDSLTATLVIRMNANGRMTVCTSFNTDNGSVSDTLAPFVLKGTPDEMDEGFLEALSAPVETVKGLVSNIEAFNKSAKDAERNAKTSASKPASTSSATDFAKKAAEEKARKDAEAKAKKENYDKAIAAAREANSKGNYFTAEAILNLADSLTDDKKEKAEIAKMIKVVVANKEGFLCNDDAASATAAIDAFKSGMVTASVQETPVETKGGASDVEADSDEAEEDVENEDDNA